MLIEYTKTPLAVGTRTPRFSWDVKLPGRSRKQSAYQLLVASSKSLLQPGQADLWDSGKVESTQSVDVEYDGAALRSNMDCYWSVQIWDEHGEPNGFREPEYFATALFAESDWSAKWIGMGPADEATPDPTVFQRNAVPPEIEAIEPDLRSPQMRCGFTLDSSVARARAFVCGLGFFELRLNGSKVGDDVLATPRTHYRHRVLYAVYDITEQLQSGENVVGLLLGNSWFNGQKRYWGWQQQWHGSPRGIVQLEIEFTDGSRQQIISDESWQGSWSPITFNSVYDGERYDARLEQPGWDRAEFEASSWDTVNVVPPPGGRLLPVTHEQEKVTETVHPISVTEPEPGVFVYDLGVNMTGWVRLRIKGGDAGDTVTLHYGEAQHENGALNSSSNNAAHQRDEYTLKGSGEETYEPRFTFHGFQFVEIRGYPGKPDLDAVTGLFVRTAVAKSGSFACGNDLINKIHQCTLQSQLCNVQLGVPTDDTQRPERLGWGADAWATAQEALYNLWMPRVYQKYIQDFCDQQSQEGMVGMIAPQPGAEEDLVWSSAFLLIPWWQYLHCGDRRILEENYAAFERYMEFLSKTGVKEVDTLTSDEILSRLLWHCGEGNRFPADEDRGYLQISQWGDHLATAEGAATRSNMPLSIATAFYYLDISLMWQIADAVGRKEDAERYRELGQKVKAAFNQRFFDAKLGYYDTGVQSAQAWALSFGLTPDEERQRVTNYLIACVADKQRHLTTGYCSTKWAIRALSEAGRDDLVWMLAVSTSYPSWGYMLRNNRTTSCEQWNGDRGSLNHAPLGAAIDEWFYAGLAGIQPDPAAPGFEHIIFKPHLPADLPWVKASLQTARGRIVSEWKQDDATATLQIVVPANSTARVHLPADTAESISESGVPAAEADGVAALRTGENETIADVGSGEYKFVFPVPSS